MIRINNLTISYGNELIINNSSLNANKGKVYVISGPSGTGKSSILQVIGLLQKQNYESFYIGKDSIDHLNASLLRKNNIGYVFQEKNLYEYLTVYENLQLFSYIVGNELSESKAMEILKLVKLDINLDLQAQYLSGGEKQRLAIACALVKESDIIIADEPSSGLDSVNEQEIMNLFISLAHKYNKCIIIASHSKYILEHSDEVITIDNKRIITNEVSKEEKLIIKKTKINHKFYKVFIEKSPLIKGKLYLFLTLMLSLVIGLYVITTFINQKLLQQSNTELNQLIQPDIKLVFTENVNDRNINYYSKIEHISDCNYYYDIDTDGMIIHALYDYMDKELSSNEIIITKPLANHLSITTGDHLYIYYFNQSFIVKEILDQQLDAFCDLNQNIVYVSNDLLSTLNTNKLILHIDNFNKMEEVIEFIYSLKQDVLVVTADNSYIYLSQLQESIITFVKSISRAMLIVICLLFTYIEYLDMKHHQFEFALLKANGLTNLELNLLLILRTVLHSCLLFIFSIVFIIIMDYLLKFASITLFDLLAKQLINALVLSISLTILPLGVTIIVLYLISPNILLKN